MSQSSVMGGFGERVIERIVARDMFVPAVVEDVVISKRVEYYSGPLGGPMHTGSLSVIKRWNEEDTRNIRMIGVAPRVYLRIYVKPINERMLVRMSPSDVVQFGEFSSLRGRFSITDDEVEVKVNSDSVVFEDYGGYARAGDVSDTMTYSSFLSMRHRVFDRAYQCGEEIEDELRGAWAKREGIHSRVWRVSDVDDKEYSDTVEVEVECEGVSERLSFCLSMDEWDDNTALRNLVEKDGSGLVSNLEGEDVYVSFAELGNEVAECDGWFLYRSSGIGSVIRRVKSVLR